MATLTRSYSIDGALAIVLGCLKRDGRRFLKIGSVSSRKSLIHPEYVFGSPRENHLHASGLRAI